MRTIFVTLAIWSSAHALEFGFDANVPAREKRIVRDLLPNANESRHPTRWTSQNVLRFAWINGGNVSSDIAPWLTAPAVEGVVNRGLYCAAWIYRSGTTTTICLNSAYAWKPDDMKAVLKSEIDIATR